MAIFVEIVTPQKSLFSGEVTMVSMPGEDGDMGVLGGHAPLLTTLGLGEIVLHKSDGTEHLAVNGGVAEVRPDKVTILADDAENADEIDIALAEEARRNAEESLAEGGSSHGEHTPPELNALRWNLLRLKVARKRQSGS